jgi:3',5'-cyclic AMP phosphodiesterase CpdA
MLQLCFRTTMLLLLSTIVISCGHKPQVYQPGPEALTIQGTKATYPEATFIVISDPHFYSKSLGSEGQAFQDYLDSDRKLLVDSEEILDAAMDQLVPLAADFVIVCGDLTKDGEKVNFLAIREKLKRLVASGKKVLVVPGNHDIANGEAHRYVEDRFETVPNVSAPEFAEIFNDYGYGSAIERDGDSLSYLAEPVPGLWVLAVDSCKWKENEPGQQSHTGGAYSAETFQWIEKILIRSKKENKAVIVFQHHGILEHYPNNDKFYSEYLVDDYNRIADMLSAFSVELVFTGHFHAQDITQKTFQDPQRIIYDIETGSTVTAPCPFRMVRISADQNAHISSRFVESIPSHKTDFITYARDYVYNGTIKLADDALIGYKVEKQERDILNPQVSRAYVTHLAGDEQKPEPVVHKEGLGLWGRFIMFMQEDLLVGWYTDLPPADNQLVIRLGSKGTVEP